MTPHDDGSVTLSREEVHFLKQAIEYQHRNGNPEFGLFNNRAWLRMNEIINAINTHCTARQLGLNPRDWTR